jgi:hypothetical protein
LGGQVSNPSDSESWQHTLGSVTVAGLTIDAALWRTEGGYTGTFGGSTSTCLGVIPVTTAWADGQQREKSSLVATRTRHRGTDPDGHVSHSTRTENTDYLLDARSSGANGVEKGTGIRLEQSSFTQVVEETTQPGPGGGSGGPARRFRRRPGPDRAR